MIATTLVSDNGYVNEQLKDKSELATFVARLLRTGELQKAFQRKRDATLLGPKLLDRIKKFRSLPKNLVVSALEGIGPANFTVEEDDEGDEMVMG